MPDGGANLSRAQRLAMLPPEQRREAVRGIEDALLWDWEFWARPEQLAPPGLWSVWGYIGGRGAGKTRTGAEWVRSLNAMGKPPTRGALVAPTAADARDVMVEGPSGLLSVFPESERPFYEPSKRRITFKNGSIATLFSAEEPQRLRGPNNHWAWCDEVGAWKYQQATWDMLMFGLRLGDNPQCLVTTTPRPTPVLNEIMLDTTGGSVLTHSTTYANRGNLASSFFSKIIRKYEGTNLGRQELMGELIGDTPGALWTRGLIERHRIDARAENGSVRFDMLPTPLRMVVAVDPPATKGNEEMELDDLPEAGIICAFKGTDGHAYVIEDASIVGSPQEWGSQAVGCYKRHRADRMVAEVNQGGEMVEYVIRSIDSRVSFLSVHASKGKITRAEPIAALYEQGRVHHVGGFPQLEDQMTTYVPGNKSPDRMDALVWALTELMLDDDFSPNFKIVSDVQPSNWRV